VSIEHKVKDQITHSWKDKRVAQWVINSLPLLEMGFTQPACPVYTLSLEKGLQEDNKSTSIKDFKDTLKLVISGGLEGTVAHLRAVDNLNEIRALTTDGSCHLVLMLEPDSYIQNAKKREPLVSLEQRKVLWSTSGLVDAIILAPDSSVETNKNIYFSQLSDIIGPTRWCTSIDNPEWLNIITRHDPNGPLNCIQVWDDEICIHASLLASSQNADSNEMKRRIYENVLMYVKKYFISRSVPPEVEAQIISKRISKGLG
jgi:hypothetical protein